MNARDGSGARSARPRNCDEKVDSLLSRQNASLGRCLQLTPEPIRRRGCNMTRSPQPLCVRSYRPSDRDRLEALWQRVFPDDPPWNAPALMIEAKLRVQPELLLVGEHDTIIVGAVIAGFDGVRGWIYHLAVAPEFRRLGLATQLVRAAEDGLASSFHGPNAWRSASGRSSQGIDRRQNFASSRSRSTHRRQAELDSARKHQLLLFR